MNDIAPELLEAVKDKFDFLVENNITIKKLYQKAADGTATYKEANQFALLVGNALAKSYKSELSSDTLPDGKMYYNIARRIFDDTLTNNYSIVADYCQGVQKDLNAKAGLSLPALRAELNEDRLRGISDFASNSEYYDDVAGSVEESVINFTQNVVNDSIQRNAEFQYESGLKSKIIRDGSSDCCEWCSGLIGQYEYPKVDKDVYRRHANCRCTVEYEPSKGKRQNVWSKEFRNIEVDTKYYIKGPLKEANIAAEKVGIADFNKNINGNYAKRAIEEYEKIEKLIGKAYVRSITALDNRASFDGIYEGGRISIKNIVGDNAITRLKDRAKVMKNSGQWSTASEMHTTRHEIGHGILEMIKNTDYDKYISVMNKLTEIYNRENELANANEKGYNDFAAKKLSIYGFDNVNDFFAEAVAEFANNKCRPLAREIVSILGG